MVFGYDCNIYWGLNHVTCEACVGPFILANHETLLTQPTGHEMNRRPPVHWDRFHGYHISGRIIYSIGKPVRHYVISLMLCLAVRVIENSYTWLTLAHPPPPPPPPPPWIYAAVNEVSISSNSGFYFIKIQKFSCRKVHLKILSEMMAILSRERWVKWLHLKESAVTVSMMPSVYCHIWKLNNVAHMCLVFQQSFQ